MELKYTRTGDYELPNLTLKDNKKGTINKYGMLRLNHLKHYKKSLYTTLDAAERTGKGCARDEPIAAAPLF